MKASEEDIAHYEKMARERGGKVNGVSFSKDAPKPKRKNKYGAIKTKIGAFTFDSRKEARRYEELRLLQHAGKIQCLIIHPSYTLHAVRGEPIGCYEADSSYFEDGEQVVEDVKSVATKTALYRWKKKHFFLEYGIEIREV